MPGCCSPTATRAGSPTSSSTLCRYRPSTTRSLAGAEPRELGTDVSSDTLAGLFYTGGTTGASKGVMLSHGNLIANAFHMMVTQQLLPGDRYAVIAPMFHAAGSFAVLATLWTGGCHVMLPVFDAEQAVDLVEREAITATLIVPTMLAAMADAQLANPRDTSSLRELGHGGSPVATEVVRRAHKAFAERAADALVRRDGDGTDRDRAARTSKTSSTARAPARADRRPSGSTFGSSTPRIARSRRATSARS